MKPIGRALALIAAAIALTPAQAQRLYKYLDHDGVWVYTDRQPASDQPYEETQLTPSVETPEVRLYHASVEGRLALIAESTYYGPVQVAFELARMDNLGPGTPRRGLRLLPARSRTELMVIEPADASRPIDVEYRFQYLPGDPEARHLPEGPYRLPFAAAERFLVSQAPPDRITHVDPASEHAIDFEMPIGSGVYAARSGIVIEVASDYYGAGLDPAVDGPRANIVRVLHDDGTMALYAHLNWQSIRVRPGQRVARGEHLADSGNTGFSTGPHLHFVVQRNRGGAIVSVPVEFSGPGGSVITLRTGDRPVAY